MKVLVSFDISLSTSPNSIYFLFLGRGRNVNCISEYILYIYRWTSVCELTFPRISSSSSRDLLIPVQNQVTTSTSTSQLEQFNSVFPHYKSTVVTWRNVSPKLSSPFDVCVSVCITVNSSYQRVLSHAQPGVYSTVCASKTLEVYS